MVSLLDEEIDRKLFKILKRVFKHLQKFSMFMSPVLGYK